MPKRLLKPSNYIKLNKSAQVLRVKGTAEANGGRAPCSLSPPGGRCAVTAGSALGRVFLLTERLCGSGLHPGQTGHLDSLVLIFWSSLGEQGQRYGWLTERRLTTTSKYTHPQGPLCSHPLLSHSGPFYSVLSNAGALVKTGSQKNYVKRAINQSYCKIIKPISRNDNQVYFVTVLNDTS